MRSLLSARRLLCLLILWKYQFEKKKERKMFCDERTRPKVTCKTCFLWPPLSFLDYSRKTCHSSNFELDQPLMQFPIMDLRISNRSCSVLNTRWRFSKYSQKPENSWNFVYIQATQRRTSLILTSCSKLTIVWSYTPSSGNLMLSSSLASLVPIF